MTEALLEHRRLLLDRVVSCRKAAEHALAQHFPETPMDDTASDLSNEIQVFREMCRRAVQLSAGLKRSGSTQMIPARDSMSMRKSTIGKKNLIVGKRSSEGIIDIDEDGITADPSIRPSMGDDFSSTPATLTNTFKDRTEFATFHRGQKQNKKYFNHKRPMQPQQQTKVIRSVSNPNIPIPFPDEESAFTDTQPYTQSYSSHLDRLRNQRKNVLTQLESIAKKRRVSILGTGPGLDDTTDALTTRKGGKKKMHSTSPSITNHEPSTPSSSPSSSDPSPLCHELHPPFFPLRVKTQWDYLLEEMRWLATDFVEERKWKRIQTRMISHAMRTHVHEREQNLISQETPRKPSPPSTNVIDEATVIVDEPMIPCEPQITEVQQESNMDEDLSLYSYVLPTASDLDKARDVACFQCAHVLRYWDTFQSPIEEEHKTEDDTILSNPYIHIVNRKKQGGEWMCNGEGLDVELTQDQITSRIHGTLNQIQQAVHCGNITHNDQDNMPIDCSNLAMKLQSSQRQAVNYFEKIWSFSIDSHSSFSPGLILSGSHSCGKTVTTAALIWKLQARKLHLVLCPCFSMV
jgi:hypothetical protein